MATNANRNYVKPKFPVIAFVVVVMLGTFPAYGTVQGTGSRDLVSVNSGSYRFSCTCFFRVPCDIGVNALSVRFFASLTLLISHGCPSSVSVGSVFYLIQVPIFFPLGRRTISCLNDPATLFTSRGVPVVRFREFSELIEVFSFFTGITRFHNTLFYHREGVDASG
jgi:hypothetical protein